MQRAIIYCRVSSEKQRKEGHGLDSQEQRCRVYAQQNNYDVEKVFRDSASGGGDFMKRPAMVELLNYIDKKRYNKYVVVFDDLKRFARDTMFHFKLKRDLESRGAKIECLNFKFEDTPEGEFIETMMAAQGQLEREQNRRQVIQKMKSRLEDGYYCFSGTAVGYKFINDPVHGKIIVPDEPKASIVKEALEGFANGRFSHKKELLDLFVNKNFNNGKNVYYETIKRMLNNIFLYAGYIEYKPWEVSLIKGFHENLISWEMAQKIKDKLDGKETTFTRKEVNPEFPLRGFVLCAECRGLMTGSYSTGRNRKHPYYRCKNSECKLRNKSIRKRDVENSFKNILSRIKPTDKAINLTKAIFKDVWTKKQKEWRAEESAKRRQLQTAQDQKERLIDLVSRASAENTIRAYESKINKLHEKEVVLKESLESCSIDKMDIGTALDIVFDFLKNPLKQWEKPNINSKRLVLRLVFQEKLAYNIADGFETATLSLPLRVFSLSEAQNSCLVDPSGIEPLTSCMPCMRSTS